MANPACVWEMIVLGRREASITLPKEKGAFQEWDLGQEWGLGGKEEVGIMVLSSRRIGRCKMESLLGDVTKCSRSNKVFTVVMQ